MPKEDSEVWVHITIQKVYKDEDGNTKNIIPRWEYISFPLKNIGLDSYSFNDPITKEAHTNTGYGISSALYAIVIKEMLNKYGGTVTETGDLII